MSDELPETRSGFEHAAPDEVAALFDDWLTATIARHCPPLTLSEVRKGVRALSSLWVERRRRVGRALDGAGKRAAFATYYAPLHFQLAWHALASASRSGAAGLPRIRRVVDVGCGTGAAGAAAATALGVRHVAACDRSAWALTEAAATYAAFRLRARTRRATLPRGLPRAERGDLLVLGWCANELPEAARDAVLDRLVASRRRGAGLLVLEPLAGASAPWWTSWVAAVGDAGGDVRDLEVRSAQERPDWIRRLDEAAGLDHRVLGARALLAGDGGPA